MIFHVGVERSNEIRYSLIGEASIWFTSGRKCEMFVIMGTELEESMAWKS